MIGVLLNHNALRVRRQHDLGDRLRRILGDDGLVVETRREEEVPDVVARFVELGCDPVGVCGGDGTNLSTITGYLRGRPGARLPRFVLLPGGTVNTVAKNLHVRGGPDGVLERLVARMRRGEDVREVPLDSIEANGRFGFLFAAAMGARFLEAYYRGPERLQGVPWAMALGARTVASSLVQGRFSRLLFDPAPVELTADGERLPIDRVRVLVASAVPDVGIGMRLMWRAGSEEGRFHLVASAMSTTRMALQMPRWLIGRPLTGQPHVDRMVQALTIRFPSPQVWTLDGDLFHDEEIELRAGPRIRVIVP